MLLSTPRFWYARRPTWLARLLQPFAALYALAVAWQRHRIRPQRLSAPVISVGNITLGGTGKTPLVMALAREFQQRGCRVAILLRGYGTKRQRPLLVSAVATAEQVGDEALELHRALDGVPVWVGRDRLAGGRAAIAAGADLLLLDDGLQHWRLARDCDISVLDAEHGLGNGLVFPAGPLREPRTQLGRADLLVFTGCVSQQPASGSVGPAAPAHWPQVRPCFRVTSRLLMPPRLEGQPLLAFCGIGLPAKFFQALRQTGSPVVETLSFPDHHPYAQAEMDQLQRRASAHGATLVTTVKDWQRLGSPWRDRVVPLPLELDHATVPVLASAALSCAQEAFANGGVP